MKYGVLWHYIGREKDVYDFASYATRDQALERISFWEKANAGTTFSRLMEDITVTLIEYQTLEQKGGYLVSDGVLTPPIKTFVA